MFEDSLVESRVLPISASKRWTTLASISLQFMVAGAVIALPLLHPEAIPFHEDSPKVMLPLLPKPPAPPIPVQRATDSPSATSNSVPRLSIMPSLSPRRSPFSSDEPVWHPSILRWEHREGYRSGSTSAIWGLIRP
jgi:periplasmic protein TonB